MTSDEVSAVLAESFLGAVDEEARAALAEAIEVVAVGAGEFLYDPRPSIVADGRLCAFVADESGRRLTVCYLQRPQAFGIGALAGRRFPVAFQALSASVVLQLPRRLVHELRTTSAAVAWAAGEELARYLDDVMAESARVAFRPVKARLAHHLLAMTEGAAGIGRPLHYHELADAVGSVREVVGRSLLALRDDGLVAAGHAGIVAVDRDGLHAAAREVFDDGPDGRERAVTE